MLPTGRTGIQRGMPMFSSGLLVAEMMMMMNVFLPKVPSRKTLPGKYYSYIVTLGDLVPQYNESSITIEKMCVYV